MNSKKIVGSILSGAIFALAVLWLDAKFAGVFLVLLVATFFAIIYGLIWALKTNPADLTKSANKVTSIAYFAIAFMITGAAIFVIFQ